MLNFNFRHSICHSRWSSCCTANHQEQASRSQISLSRCRGGEGLWHGLTAQYLATHKLYIKNGDYVTTQLSVYVLYYSSHWKTSRCSSAVTGRQKNVQKSVIMRVQSCCFAYSNCCFFDVPSRFFPNILQGEIRHFYAIFFSHCKWIKSQKVILTTSRFTTLVILH